MQKPVRVLCLGGGYVALWLTRRFRAAIRQGFVEVTVVSRDNFHTFHGFAPEVLSGRLQPEQIISPARRIFAPARFHNAEIEAIDLEKRVVVTSRLLDGRQYELPYDHLVISLGKEDDLSRYPGVAEHALRLRPYWNCFKTRSHLISMLEMAEIETDPVERQRLLTTVVVGGNFGGVEVASELLDAFRSLARHEFPGIDPDEIRVMIVHGGSRILPELQQASPRLVRYAEKSLAKVGLEVRTGTRLAAATPEEAILSTGERIPTRSIISCAGTAMPSVLRDLPLARHASGRLSVRTTGQVEGRDDVWAAGDCAALPHPHGGICPQVAIYAMVGGRHVAANILRSLRGKNLKPFRFSGLGEAATLGFRRAVYYLKGLPVTGALAWMLWRLTFLGFIPGWELRLRILSNWLVVALTGRNIVNVHMHEQQGIHKERYEAGQDIVRQGDVGRQLFILWKGEVDVFQEQPDGSINQLARLGPGQHFGETAIFNNVRRTATVRARTPVEVLALGHSATLALSASMSPFGERIRALPVSAPDLPLPGPAPKSISS